MLSWLKQKFTQKPESWELKWPHEYTSRSDYERKKQLQEKPIVFSPCKPSIFEQTYTSVLEE